MKRRCVLVVGMHRSGTSAVAGALAMAGAGVSSDLLPGNESNPKGHFESAAAVALDDQLLASFGMSWHDGRPLPAGWEEREAATSAKDRIRDFMQREFGENQRLALVKDPRMSRLLPVWLDVLAGLGWEALVVLVLRHPSEVCGSLYRRDGTDAMHAQRLWLTYNLEAEQASRETARRIIDFDDVLAGNVIAHDLADWIGLEPDSTQAAFQGFVEDGLRHFRSAGGGAAEKDLLPSVIRVWDLLRGCRSSSDGFARLEDILHAFRDAQALLPASLDGPGTAHATPSAAAQATSRGCSIGPEFFATPVAIDEVLALYWRHASASHAEDRSVQHRFPRGSGMGKVRLGVPAGASVDYLRIDPALTAGLFEIWNIRIDGREVEAPLERVSASRGTLLDAGGASRIRLYSGDMDPWVELDVRDLWPPEGHANPIIVEVDVRRTTALEDLARRISELECRTS